ncbi:hypothetical protein [Brevundimonas sp.]|uniref:hypothetical protein n=1 Tax=Brevundimonas sp. TaxID=1871086 RepID=UPI003F6EC7B6
MKTWVWMLGGLIVWAIHFVGVYLISSVADVVATADDARWRMAALAFSGLCVLASALVLQRAVRRCSSAKGASMFKDQTAAFAAGVTIVAIVWQALPTLIGH